MRLQRIAGDIEAGFHGRDAAIDNQADRHLAEAHAEHFEKAHRSVGQSRSQPEIKEAENDETKNECDERDDADAHEVEGFHTGKLSGPAKGPRLFGATVRTN